MCRRAECPRCHRPTWKGCGAHVEQVLGDVKPADRCHCADEPRAGARGSSSGGWLSKLVGR